MGSMLRTSGKMSLEEIFEFDLTGFLVVRNVISEDVINRMNKVIDRDHKDKHIIEFPFLELDPMFLDLLTHPKVLDICEELLGDWFRFEQAIGIQEMPPNIGVKLDENLHGGHMVHQGSFQYQWNGTRPHCGMLAFSYILKDVKAGDGGLVVVPGSHKLNLPLDGREIWKEVAENHFDHSWIKNPALKAGDMLVFTEALIHGTQAWKPRDRGRRILYYRYCPGYMAWRDYGQVKNYAKLARTDLEKRLFEPSYVGFYDENDKPRWRNNYKKSTRQGK